MVRRILQFTVASNKQHTTNPPTDYHYAELRMWMERTYNVGLFQDSSGRDLKSAQNTPSRQPLAPPNPANQGQASMAPPPLQSQDNRTSVLAGQDFSKKVDI